MNAIRTTALLVAKDLRIEVRTCQTVGMIVVLGALIVAVLALGLSGLGKQSGSGAAAIIWVAFLFSGVLCCERSMRVEREDDALSALLLSPAGPGVIFAAKLLSNLLLLLALAAVLTPLGVAFIGLDVPLGSGVLTLALSMIGFAAVGTLFSAAPSSSRSSGGLVPLLVFPLTFPLVIASTRAAMETGPAGQLGLAVLIAFDIIFLTAGWLVFEFLLDA